MNEEEVKVAMAKAEHNKKFKKQSGLEALKEIKDDVVAEYIDDYKTHFYIIEKELKALEIIKEKKVNIKLLLIDKDCELYNMNYGYEDLTQEEYDLLKEAINK